jgi:ATP-dependent RNA circularization protein (DNA/RNA ligase family)
VCGRNFAWNKEDLQGKIYWDMEAKYNVLAKISKTPYCIQGEICGPKIQNNTLLLSENQWFVFNIFNSETNKYVHQREVLNLCHMWGFETVPCIVCDIDYENFLYKSIDLLLDLTDIICYSNGNPVEGIVVKTSDDKEPRISFKVMSRIYNK